MFCGVFVEHIKLDSNLHTDADCNAISMLSFRSRLNIVIFLPILGSKYSCSTLTLYHMTFPLYNLLGYQLQVLGIVIQGSIHCARAPSALFAAVSEAKMSRQTTLGRFGFEKSISHRNSLMEILFQLCQGQLSVIT